MENHRFISNSDSAKTRSNKKRIRQQKVHVNAQDSVHASVNPASSNTEDHYNQPKTPPHSVHATVNRASHDAEDHFGYPNYESSHHDSSMDTGGKCIIEFFFLMQCRHCNAKMWYNESILKRSNTSSPRFSLCCGDGKVELPFSCKKLSTEIRTYNMMFAFTSAGIKFDKTISHSRGPPTIRIQGQPCHRIGSLLPMPRKKPKFSQLYIYETENEVQNRINTMSHYNEIEAHIVSNLQKMLDENNAHAKSFRMARDRLTGTEVHNVKLKLIFGREKDGRTYNVPSVPDVAALIAEDGYRPDILHRDTLSGKKRKRNCLTMREWFAYRLQCRPNEGQTLLHSRKLFQQFVAEGYTMIESERLSYVRKNQKKLRVDKFCSLQQSSDAGNTKGLSKGKRIILPSTFVGSPRYMDQLYFDGIAICSHVGFPNLFITFTCNPNWPEIHRLLTPLNLTAIDKPEIISRIFKLKYEHMLSDLTKNHLLGKVVAYMYTIEFQKRGLPHEDDPELYKLVQNHMVHGPCGILRPASPCMKEGKCSRFYPKKFQPTTLIDGDGYPMYRRRNTGQTITKNGIIIDYRCIVPYNPKLLKKYQAHINIEWCSQNSSIKYLFKYINKGYDRVTVVMVHDDNGTIPHANTPNDEIKEYLDCRYISPCESTWRIFGFPIQGRKPSVERLNFHLPGQYSVLYQDHDDIDDLLSNPSISESKFIAWMNTNQAFVEGQSLTYSEFVTKFIMMLTVSRGPISFEDIRTVAGVEYPTYRETCFAMAKDWGSTPYLRNLFVLLLLTGTMNKPEQVWEKTWHWLSDDILYSHHRSTSIPGYGNIMVFHLRLVVSFKTRKGKQGSKGLSKELIQGKSIWLEAYKNKIALIISKYACELGHINKNQAKAIKKMMAHQLHIGDSNLMNLVLLEVEQLLQANQRSLKDYPSMPYLENANLLTHADNGLILTIFMPTDQQTQIYNQIIQVVNKNEGGMFFLYGYGGTGKTFFWKTLVASLRADNKIVIMVASSNIASLLLSRGRTTHSKLKIPIPIFEDSTCNIHQGTQLAKLLNEASLIIWDEAPMAHKFYFEALDQSQRDVIKAKSSSDKIFDGKVMVFGGDFRQILSIIPRGSRSDIVNATINSSYLWNYCHVLTLSKNMRLEVNIDATDKEETLAFAQWILDIGDGIVGKQNDGYGSIEIPKDLLITEYDDPFYAIVNSIFPNLSHHHTNPEYFQSTTILASTNETLQQVNDYILSLIPGEQMEYLSVDYVDKSETLESSHFRSLTTEFLNSLTTSVKDYVCNDTRLIVTRLAKHVIAADIISGKNIGQNVYIPRMSMSPSQSPCLLRFEKTVPNNAFLCNDN
ncbi:hypothetical protein AAZX31_17G179600 [Glycine max]